jgi:hypothetical protein
MSTIVWGMLVSSSILSHYASSYPDSSGNYASLYPDKSESSDRPGSPDSPGSPDRPRSPDRPESLFSSVHLAKVLADVLRWVGKFLAIVNAICIILTGMLQFTSVYDNCYCNASVLGLGMDGAYAVIFPSDAQVHLTWATWIAAFALGSSGCVGFFFVMNLFTDPLPQAPAA